MPRRARRRPRRIAMKTPSESTAADPLSGMSIQSAPRARGSSADLVSTGVPRIEVSRQQRAGGHRHPGADDAEAHGTVWLRFVLDVQHLTRAHRLEELRAADAPLRGD